MKKHLLLVGLPGSGKTTVGRLVARSLGVDAVDIDEEIEKAERRSVREIFASRGEEWFREVEALRTEMALAAPSPAVIVPGGGWAAQPGNLETVGGRAAVVYLEIPPETVAGRLPAGSRPLLSGSSPVAEMRALLARREAYYQRSDQRVAAGDRTAEEVARIVVELARRGPSE